MPLYIKKLLGELPHSAIPAMVFARLTGRKAHSPILSYRFIHFRQRAVEILPPKNTIRRRKAGAM